MNAFKVSAWLLLATCWSITANTQEPEALPTLKLDRIPAMPAFAGQTRAPVANKSIYRVDTLTTGLSTLWALAFLPDGSILINEYVGSMRIIDSEGIASEQLQGLPEISHEGWVGLFDLALDPDFEKNNRVYFSYTAPSGDPESPNIPRVASATLDAKGLRLKDVVVIVDSDGQQEMHFAPDGTLFLSGVSASGDGQDLSTHTGKLLRINADGSIPQDNPVFGDADTPSAIFSMGHRDVSGIAVHPETGELWMTEHGPRGGDELNRIVPGANYGWPIISYGTNYTGEPVGEGEARAEGLIQPRYFWRPSIAPSGLMIYSADMFPEWRDNTFVTSLSGQHITRLEMDGYRVVAEEKLLVDRGHRTRELRQGADGALCVLTNEESDGPQGTAELLRISK